MGFLEIAKKENDNEADEINNRRSGWSSAAGHGAREATELDTRGKAGDVVLRGI